MKKVLSLVSVTLSLVLIAATILVVPTFAASGSTVGENLLANPELNYTDNGDGSYSVEGWTIPSNVQYKRSSRVYTDTDGKTVIEMQSTDVDTAVNFATATANKQTYMLNANKNYKFTALIKIEAPDMAKDSTGATATFNHNTGYYGAYIYYQVGNSDYYRSAKRIYTSPANDWEEYSFIIKGSDIAQGQWQYFWGVKMYGMRAKISIKSPCVAEYDGDALTEETVEIPNLLTNGILGFTAPMGASADQNACLAHTTETVSLNGKDVTALKITTKQTNDDYYAYYMLKADGSSAVVPLQTNVKYRFSAWVKCDIDTYNKDLSSVGVAAGFRNGNTSYVGDKGALNNEWQKIEYIIDPDNFTIATTWQYRAIIRITAIAGDIYIAQPKLEKFAGEVKVDEANQLPKNIIANGNFETYDAENDNIFSGWTFATNSNTNNVHTVTDGVTGKALRFTNASQDYPYTGATTVVNVDSSKDYVLTAKVKVTEPTNGTWGTVGWGGGVRLQVTASNGAIQEIRSNEINYKTNDWVTLTANIKDLPQNVTNLNVKIVSGSTGCDVYIDDVSLVPVTGGILNVDRIGAIAGDTVYVTANVDDGYYLDSISYNDGTADTKITQTVSDIICATNSNCNTYSQLASDSVYQFTMPDENVTVKADFKKIVLGDINGNETVDIRDLVRLALYLGDDTTVIATVNADVDGNGTIETADVTALRETLLNQ